MSWKGICSPRCFTAKSDEKYCKCKCHGAHHGVGYNLAGNIAERIMVAGVNEALARLDTPLVGSIDETLRQSLFEKDGKTVRPYCGHCKEWLIFDKEKGWVHQDGSVYKQGPDGKDDHCVLPKFRQST